MAKYVVKKTKTNIFSLFLLFDRLGISRHLTGIEISFTGFKSRYTCRKSNRAIVSSDIIAKIIKVLKLAYMFDLILYVPVNIFQSCWDGSSWVKDKVSAQGHNAVPQLRLEPATLDLESSIIPPSHYTPQA